MLIDIAELESCSSIEEILELCVEPMKKLLTYEEQDEVKAIVREDDIEMIKELGGMGDKAHTKAQTTMLNNYLLYYLTVSAKTCICHVYPSDNYTEDDAFFLVGSYYLTVIEFSLLLVRQSLLNKSLSANGNSSIKSISSNGRSVTFMSGAEAIEQAQLPVALQQRLPKPKPEDKAKAKIRVW